MGVSVRCNVAVEVTGTSVFVDDGPVIVAVLVERGKVSVDSEVELTGGIQLAINNISTSRLIRARSLISLPLSLNVV